MTSLDDRLIPRISALLQKYGRQVVYQSRSSAYTASQSAGVFTPTSHDVYVSPPMSYETYQVDGVDVMTTDSKVFMAAKNLAFVPTKDDVVTLNTILFRVVKVTEYSTGEQTALYELQLRRA